jgi:hypothetical protein
MALHPLSAALAALSSQQLDAASRGLEIAILLRYFAEL